MAPCGGGSTHALCASRARGGVHADPGEGSVSVAALSRHVHGLRRRIRRFEERFEREKRYKVGDDGHVTSEGPPRHGGPFTVLQDDVLSAFLLCSRCQPAHNDKTADPEVSRMMTELARSRRKLKGRHGNETNPHDDERTWVVDPDERVCL